MSQTSRPRSRGLAQRRRRSIPLEAPLRLEDRCLLAPVLATVSQTVTATPVTTPPPPDGVVVQNIAITAGDLASSPAPITTVSQLTPISAFGNDVVRIKAGPGGEFGKGVYAISRGGGGNSLIPGTVNRPGVIYRVDPTTGQSMVFFDLNTVINQLQPGGTAANSLGFSTGLVNWYDIEFDPEGYFRRPAVDVHQFG